MNVRSFLEEKAARLPNKTCLVFHKQEFTYSEFDQLVNRVANSLSLMGIGHGDRVGGFMPNCSEWLVLYFALAKLGATNVFVNTQYDANLLHHAFKVSDVKAVMVSRSLMQIYKKVQKHFSGIVTEILVEDEGAGMEVPQGMVKYDELIEGSISPPPEVRIPPGTPLQFIFTSGTTGLPKPCIASHRYLLSLTKSVSLKLDATSEDRFLSCLPNYHGNVYIGIFSALMADAVAIVENRFSASRYWKWVRDYQATVLTLHITPMNILMKQPMQADDAENSARAGIFLVGEEAIPFVRRFGLKMGLAMYGSTEAGGFCTMSSFGPEASHDPRFAGKPRDEVEVQVWDKDDELAPPNTEGEIVIRDKKAHTIFSGYFKMPEKTAKACCNFWFHSGDMGFMDENGSLYFMGRAEESIRVKGEFIPVDKLESCVRQHPDVIECAAVGVPSDIGEEEISLFVKMQPGTKMKPEAIIEHCRENLPRYMIPRYINYIDEFPLASSALKIQKVKLKEKDTCNSWDRFKECEPDE